MLLGSRIEEKYINLIFLYIYPQEQLCLFTIPKIYCETDAALLFVKGRLLLTV